MLVIRNSLLTPEIEVHSYEIVPATVNVSERVRMSLQVNRRPTVANSDLHGQTRNASL